MANPFDQFDGDAAGPAVMAAPAAANPFDQFDAEPPVETIEGELQTPLETFARAAAQAPGQSAMSAYSGIGRTATAISETIHQKLPAPLAKIAGAYFDAASYIPRHLGPLATDIAAESERVYKPDRQTNPKAAAVGSGVGQALPMAATAIVAGPAGPLALGAAQGADQGIEQAEEMGITDPAAKLAMGGAYAGIETLTEKMGGFGSKALTEPVKRTLGQAVKEAGKTVLSESIEEPIAGTAQDFTASQFAPDDYDASNLSPFTVEGGLNPAWLQRRELETIGGAAGGVIGAGVQALASSQAPAPAQPDLEADPLAAAAAQMPQRSADTPVRSETPAADKSVRAPANPFDQFDSPAPVSSTPPLPVSSSQVPAFTDPTLGTRYAQAKPEGDIMRDYRIYQRAPLFRDPDELAPAQAGAGNVFIDMPKTPEALAAQREEEQKRALIRGRAQIIAQQADKPPRIPDAPYGGYDILDYVNDKLIAVPRAILDVINQRKGATLAPQQSGDFNWLKQYEVPKSFRKYLFKASEDESSNINEVAQDAFDDNLIDDPTPDALMAAILNTIDSRENYKVEIKAREQDANDEEKRVVAFEKAETRSRKDGGKTIPFSEMYPGDEMTIDGEPVEVLQVETDEDGYPMTVTLKDGARFGVLKFDAAAKSGVIADEWKPRARIENSGFTDLDVSGTTAGFLNADIINEGINLIAQGVRDFAAWSKAMLAKFGAAIRDYLQGVWQAAVKTSEQGFIGTGNDERFAPPDEIRLTHEDEGFRRAAEGKPPLPTGGQGTVEQWTAEARARVQQPGAAGALVSDIIDKQRTATTVEHMMMVHYAAALDAALEQSNRTLANPATTPEARAAAAENKRVNDAERERVAVAQQIAGSKWGAAGRARQVALARDSVPSLAKMVADITLILDPTGQTLLPADTRDAIEQVHGQMTAAQQELDKHEQAGGRQAFNEELQRLLAEAREQLAWQEKAIEEAMKPRPAPIQNTGLRAKIKSRADEARARLRAAAGQTNIGLDPTLLMDYAAIAADYIAQGVDMALAMTKEFGMKIREHLADIRKAAQGLIDKDAKQKPTPADVLARARTAAKESQLPPDELRTIARQLALAHIIDHLERNDATMSAAKIADLVRDDLQEFQPDITPREARDLISGYGQSSQPSKDAALKTLRDYKAQMQKITQLEALRNLEALKKSGPQRDKPSAELRELQKQVEALKRELGYQSRSREDELKSARDRIQSTLENQIEDLQRVLAGKQRPTAPRERVVYDAELQALQTLRNHLRELVAQMPQHKAMAEARRNKAALKAAQASEAEWNRRAKAQEWKRPGKPPMTFTAEVEAARAKAKEARANFEALKKASDPRNDPEAVALRQFKARIKSQIDQLRGRIRSGDFEPKPRTPRQVKHDTESEKLKHELAEAKKQWIDLKLKHKLDTMGMAGKSIHYLRQVYHTSRALMTGGEFSGLLRQGFFKTVSHPLRVISGDIPAMLKAFRSSQGEFNVLNSLQMRPNGVSGRYTRAKLALYNPNDYSSMLAEGNARSAWANKIPFIAGTGRAYSALLAHMRADLFDMMTEKLEADGKRELSDIELQAIGEFVNDSTGAGKLGIGNMQVRSGGAKDLLGAFIFSPAYVGSRVRLLAGASLYGGTMRTRQAIAGEYLRMAAGTAAVYALLSMLADPDDDREEFDPRSSGFLKLRFGDTKLDIMAGLSQIAVLAARLWMGEITKQGKTIPIRGEGVPFNGTTAEEVMVRFIRSKASPGFGFAWNRITGKDFSGKPTTLSRDLMQLGMPITAESIAEIARNQPVEKAIPLGAAAYLGLGTQTYDSKR